MLPAGLNHMTSIRFDQVGFGQGLVDLDAGESQKPGLVIQDVVACGWG
jgi:hypothetical protein